MSDDKHSAVLEIFLHTFLDHLLRFDVNGSSGLIQDDEFGFFERTSGEADKLLLSLAQVSSISVDLHFQTILIIAFVLES